MKTRNFKRVMVWELPVRIFHWLNVLAVLVLIVTGFLIASPPALLSSAEATNLHSFGIIRFIHFTAAYVFFFVMILRLYWALVGNRFSSWRAFLPSKRKWHNFKHVLRVDVLLQNDKIHDEKNISIGHNSMALLSYLAMFIIAVLQVFTGFALYADMSSWFLPKLFSWVIPMFGGDFIVRTIHHISTWIFIFFSLIHIYLVFYHDWLEGRGEVSSMFGGYKFVRGSRIKKTAIEGAKKIKEKENENILEDR